MSQLSPRPELEPDFRDYEPIHPEPGWKSFLRKLWAPIVGIGAFLAFALRSFVWSEPLTTWGEATLFLGPSAVEAATSSLRAQGTAQAARSCFCAGSAGTLWS